MMIGMVIKIVIMISFYYPAIKNSFKPSKASKERIAIW